jgi:hypothetical protein
MPVSGPAKGNDRSWIDSVSRVIAESAMSFLYRVGIFIVAIAALGVAAYGYTLSFGEGARSLIFFFIPALWGAYALAINDGQPKALEQMTATVANSLSVLAGLVVAAVVFLDWPVSTTNLALGTMAAFFFLIRISKQTPQHMRELRENRTIVRSLLIMMTVVCAVVAVAA